MRVRYRDARLSSVRHECNTQGIGELFKNAAGGMLHDFIHEPMQYQVADKAQV